MICTVTNKKDSKKYLTKESKKRLQKITKRVALGVRYIRQS